MDYIEIQGFKSIREAHIDIKPINILIGANGAGKSNFISFFEFFDNLYNQRTKAYVNSNGGFEKFLYGGPKVTKLLNASLSFNNNQNAYSFSLGRGEDEFVFASEKLWYMGNSWEISSYDEKAEIKTNSLYRSKYIRRHLDSFKKYHFHDTGKQSPFSSMSNIENDIYFLYEKGENLAAFLFNIQKTNIIIYNRIIKTIQNIAPYFSDFFFQPNQEGYLRLQWQDKFNSTVYGASNLSDGTIRFIALTTLFMQPNLPATLIIDEPELGLHPTAIGKLSGMIEAAASKGTQVIIATQSTDLISYFTPEDIITVDQIDGASIFNRLNEDDFTEWMNDYTMGELWKRNILQGGQPS